MALCYANDVTASHVHTQ